MRVLASSGACAQTQGGTSTLRGDPEISGHRETGDAAFSEAISKFGSSYEATNGATVRRRNLHDPPKGAALRVVVEQRLHGRPEGEGQVVWPNEQLIDSIHRRDLLSA